MFFLVLYIVDDFYGKYSNYAFFIHPFKYGNFDTIVYETTEKDLEEQITKENIAGKASITLPLLQCKYISVMTKNFLSMALALWADLQETLFSR